MTYVLEGRILARVQLDGERHEAEDGQQGEDGDEENVRLQPEAFARLRDADVRRLDMIAAFVDQPLLGLNLGQTLEREENRLDGGISE